MARFLSDLSQISFQYESGLYASQSGGSTFQWLGQVQNHTLNDEGGVVGVRYATATDRNVDQFVDGPIDVTGRISYFPTDWKMLIFTLGSNVDGGSPSPYTHVVTEADSNDGNAFTSGQLLPFMSFTLEDSQVVSTGSNFRRIVNGCIIDSFTVNSSQGGIVECNVDYVGQSVQFASAAVGTVTAATTRPFLWSDIRVHIPSGTVVQTVREVSATVDNNLDRPHYLNGSREISVPIPRERDYTVVLKLDGDTVLTKTFYDAYFKGGSTFNMLLQITDSGAGLGSRDMFWIMSGCKLIDMEAPTVSEGINEQTLTINPRTTNVNISDQIQLYNPW